MRGGKRNGSGRKKGQVAEQTARRKAIAEQALESGISPLDIMLDNMRFAFEEAGKLLHGIKASTPAGEPVNQEDWKQLIRMRGLAQTFAADAAPYVHPKLASTEVKADVNLTTEQEILEGLNGLTRGLPNGIGGTSTDH